MTRANAARRRKKQRNDLLAMVLIGAGLVVLGVGALFLLPKPGANAGAQEYTSAIPVEVNFPAPELTLTDLQGRPVSLADYRGRVVLVNNWATWCPPCKAEMPTLQAYYEDTQAAGLTIVAIEAGEAARDVAAFVKDYGLTFPVWPDIKQVALSAFRNNGLPNSYLIDRGGTVRLAWNGAISREVLDEYVTPFLEE